MEPEHTDDLVAESAFDSDKSIQTIVNWVEECQQTHERCTATTPDLQQPRRLVELIDFGDEPRLRLRLVETEPGQKVLFTLLFIAGESTRLSG